MITLLQTDAAAVEQVKDIILPDSVQKAQFAKAVQEISQLSEIDFKTFMTGFAEEAVWVLLKIALALAIYMVGKWITNWILRVMDKAFKRHKVEVSLAKFLRGLVRVVMIVLVVLAAVQTLGVNTTSFVAIFASAGVAIGMALSGTLQNFAGGVVLLLLRPYRVGDYINAQGQSGSVEEIGIFFTKLRTVDNRIIYIPNSGISSSIVDNYSQPETRRVDWIVTISYGDDVDVAREAILEMLNADSRVMHTPAEPVVVVSNLGDSAVELKVRAWCANDDYWTLFFDMNETMYKELPKRGINFPFPQLDVHVKQN